MSVKLDVLVIGAHPDDAELGCGGTIIKHVSMEKKVGIVDLTQGELGTRGSAELRSRESADSAGILGLEVRENLKLADGFFENGKTSQLAVIRAIRTYRPEIILANAIYDRHSDHGRAAALVHDSIFLSGLVKIKTENNGVDQAPWRPRVLYHYIQSQLIQPDFIVDISGHWDKKIEAIRAFKSQFYDPNSKEPESYISTPTFLKMVEARAIEFGHAIGRTHGEGFTVRRTIGVNSLMDIF
jgi:N-acetylglucosamine malate deacetylase 1